MNVRDFSGIITKEPLPNPEKMPPCQIPEVLDDYIDSLINSLGKIEMAGVTSLNDSSFNLKLDEAKRALHTLKGESGIIGYSEISELCHQTETALGQVDVQDISDILLRFKDWVDSAMQFQTGRTMSFSRADIGEKDIVYSLELKPRTLVVEDDSVCRNTIISFLREQFECDTAGDGHEAIELFRRSLGSNRRYDLICMDINMPLINGVLALSIIRKIEHQHNIMGLDGVKIIMVTVNDASEYIFGSFRAGCEAYIIKPVEREELFGQIKNLGITVDAQ